MFQLAGNPCYSDNNVNIMVVRVMTSTIVTHCIQNFMLINPWQRRTLGEGEITNF
jgi:hypothetical protein